MAEKPLRMRRRLEKVEAAMVVNLQEGLDAALLNKPCACVRVINHEKGLTLTIVRCKRCLRLRESMRS